MSLQILRRQPTQTIGARSMCLNEVLRRIREREHRERARRAYWRRFFGQERQIPVEDENEYTSSIALAKAIVGAGVILFCACLMICLAVMVFKATAKPSSPRKYVIQSWLRRDRAQIRGTL